MEGFVYFFFFLFFFGNILREKEERERESVFQITYTVNELVLARYQEILHDI